MLCIEEIDTEVLPQQKVDLVRKLYVEAEG